MRFAALTLLATTALALPTTTTKRTTDTSAISSLESAASQLSTTLSAAYYQLQTYDAAGSGSGAASGTSSPGTVAVLVANIENNIAEAISLFSNLASEDVSTANAYDMAESLQNEVQTLTSELTSAQSQLGGLEKRQDGISVNGIDELLGDLVPGISDQFNEIADIVEGLGLPPLPVG